RVLRTEKCGIFVFFFQAEDGIRDWSVTGVKTCALPISQRGGAAAFGAAPGGVHGQNRRQQRDHRTRGGGGAHEQAGPTEARAIRSGEGRVGESGGGGGGAWEWKTNGGRVTGVRTVAERQ